MTDGIIQQVIKSWMHYKPYNSVMLESIQQELIEKIKQEFPDIYPFSHVYNTVMIKSKLIGDNKE